MKNRKYYFGGTGGGGLFAVFIKFVKTKFTFFFLKCPKLVGMLDTNIQASIYFWQYFSTSTFGRNNTA